jgi:hypothetical protein
MADVNALQLQEVLDIAKTLSCKVELHRGGYDLRRSVHPLKSIVNREPLCTSVAVETLDAAALVASETMFYDVVRLTSRASADVNLCDDGDGGRGGCDLYPERDAKFYRVDVLALCTTINMIAAAANPAELGIQDIVHIVTRLRLDLVRMVINTADTTGDAGYLFALLLPRRKVISFVCVISFAHRFHDLYQRAFTETFGVQTAMT